jgi:hypothetical protein
MPPLEDAQFVWGGRRYAGTSTLGEVRVGTGAAIAGAGAWAGAELPAGTVGNARHIADLGFIVLDGLPQVSIVPDDLLREPIVPAETGPA